MGPLRRPVSGLAFLADGAFLASVCQENMLRLWDLDARSATTTLWGQSEESFVAVSLFGESNRLAVALADGRIRTWGPAS